MHAPLHDEPLAEPAEPLHPLEPRGAGEDARRANFIARPSGSGKRAGVLLLVADDLAAEVDQDLGDVDLDRADLVAGAAERGGVGERAGVLDPDELRRQDRADRAGVDRVVGVAAGPLVDRADVQAGAAADAVAASGGRSGSARTLVRPLSSRTRWNSCGPSPGATPVQNEVYGFIRSPWSTAAGAGGRPRSLARSG